MEAMTVVMDVRQTPLVKAGDMKEGEPFLDPESGRIYFKPRVKEVEGEHPHINFVRVLCLNTQTLEWMAATVEVIPIKLECTGKYL